MPLNWQGTDRQLDPDSDNDGVADGEVAYGSDPTDTSDLPPIRMVMG